MNQSVTRKMFLVKAATKLKALFNQGLSYPKRPIIGSFPYAYEVLETVNPDSFFVELKDAGSIDTKRSVKRALETFKEAVSRRSLEHPAFEDLWEHMPVVVSDKHGFYFRAEVNCMYLDKKILDVSLVDSGQEVCVSVSNIYLPSIDLVRYPKLAVPCRLATVVPITSTLKNVSSGWTDMDYKQIFRGNKTSVLRCEKLDRGIHHVFLECDGVDVGHRMVVDFTGLSSFLHLPLKMDKYQLGTYPKTDFSGWMGQKISAYGIKVLTISVVVIQLDAMQVNKTIELIADYVSTVPNVENLQFEKNPGSPCLARYEDDEFCRATIIQQTKSGYFEIKYVDYGESDIVKESQLIKIPDHLISVPEGATVCELLDVTENQVPKDEKDTLSQLKSLLEFQDVYCRIHVPKFSTRKEISLGVRLAKPEGDNGLEIPFPNLLNINTILSTQKYLGRVNPYLSTNVMEILLAASPSEYIPGMKYEGVLSCAENEQSVWLQLEENYMKAELLSDEMTEYYSKWSGEALYLENIKTGEYVVCQQPDDPRWYRAKVLNVDVKKGLCHILFLDYGNHDFAVLETIFPMIDYFARYKCLALKLTLPVTLKPKVDLDLFSEFILKFSEGVRLSVWLDNTNTLILKDKLSLNEELAKNGFVEKVTLLVK